MDSTIILPCGCSSSGPCKTAKLLYKRLQYKRYVSGCRGIRLTYKTRISNLYLHLEHSYMQLLYGENYANKELNISEESPSIIGGGRHKC